MFLLKGAAVAALALFLSGCAAPRDQLTDTHLFEEHQLVEFPMFGVSSYTPTGPFFFSTGAGEGLVQGTMTSNFIVHFQWKAGGRVLPLQLPYSRIRIAVDDSKETPTVLFNFDLAWLDDNDHDLFSDAQKADLNGFVTSSALQFAEIRISAHTLEQEVFLPKLR